MDVVIVIRRAAALDSYGIILLVPEVLRIASGNCHGIMMLGKVIREEAFILQLFGRSQMMQVCWSTPCHCGNLTYMCLMLEIIWPLDLVFSARGNKSGTASTAPFQFIAYVSMWSFRGLKFCQGKLSWDPGIWVLVCFFGFFTQAEVKGRRNAAAPAYYRDYCLDHAYYFYKVCADQGC